MGRLSIKSSDVLKWGFLGQIGRNAGKDVYKGLKKSVIGNGCFVDDSTVDKSKIGKCDANGEFSYHGYETTSCIAMVGWLFGMLILAPIFAPILFIRSLCRIISKKVQFYDIYNCPIRKRDGRARSGVTTVGFQPTKFVFEKSYAEAKNGCQINNAPNNSVRDTKITNCLYLTISILGLLWFYYIYSNISHSMKQEQIVKEQVSAMVTQWTDTTIVDEFMEQSYSYEYVFPTSDGVMNTDIIIVNQQGDISFYTQHDYFEWDNNDVKLCEKDKREMYNLAGKDYHYETLVINLAGYGKQSFSKKYSIEGQFKQKLLTCDSCLVRASDKIYKFNCTK